MKRFYYKFTAQDPIIKKTLSLINGTSFASLAKDMKKGGGESVSAGQFRRYARNEPGTHYFGP